MTAPKDWVDAMEERAAAATPGPWRYQYPEVVRTWVSENRKSAEGFQRFWEGSSYHRREPNDEGIDAAFIAAARTDVPRAVAVIRAADALAAFIDDGVSTLSPSDYDELLGLLAAYKKARQG